MSSRKRKYKQQCVKQDGIKYTFADEIQTQMVYCILKLQKQIYTILKFQVHCKNKLNQIKHVV